MQKNEQRDFIPFPDGWSYEELVRQACDPNTYRTGVYVDRGLAIQVANVAVTKLWSTQVVTERQCLEITSAIRNAIEAALALPPAPDFQAIDELRDRINQHTRDCTFDSVDGPVGDFCSCGKAEARKTFGQIINSIPPAIK